MICQCIQSDCNSQYVHSFNNIPEKISLTEVLTSFVTAVYDFQNQICVTILLYSHSKICYGLIFGLRRWIQTLPLELAFICYCFVIRDCPYYFCIIHYHLTNQVIRLPMCFHSCLSWNSSPMGCFLLKSNSTYRGKSIFHFWTLSLFSWLPHIDDSK